MIKGVEVGSPTFWGLKSICIHTLVLYTMQVTPWHCLKEKVSRDFSSTIPPRSLIHALKYFRISMQIRQEIKEYVFFRAMPHNAGLFFMKTNTCGVVDPHYVT
jgi:hypothetical protein